MEIISLPKNLHGVHIHFVGIKGTGMVALVELLLAQGAIITGSDVSERFYTDEILDKYGLKALPFSEKNITDSVQYVIYSAAYTADKNPDLKAALEKKLPCMLYSEALGLISSLSYSSGVCGVHGKTTTTGLVGTILKNLDLRSQVLAGSIISSFGNSCTMTSSSFLPKTGSSSDNEHRYFVAETCEYQRHFMAFHPNKIILTSVESDHQDYYPTYNDIRDAFVDYGCKLPENGDLIYCADDMGAVETAGLIHAKRSDINLIPYGEKASGAYHIDFGEVCDGKQYFTVESLGKCALQVPGSHNVRNATAAIALAERLLIADGKNPKDYHENIKEGLLHFAGGKRRSEIVGKAKTKNGDSIIFIDDYGHHPTAIKTTLEGFRKFYSGRKIIVDFMSHTYTRTAALLNEFASCFENADEVILNKIYASAREDASAASVTGETLYEKAKLHHKNVYYKAEFEEAADFALNEINKKLDNEKYPDGYLFVTMGAGDNWKVGSLLYKSLI
ncbi:MAG: UDP-N-acetylmuramate--L-alanine ligase [Treponema sp.]|nr:UDP-N-acetylmuramate--L-alanine ligase [Treponema sp.]